MHPQKYFTLNCLIHEIFSVEIFPNYGKLLCVMVITFIALPLVSMGSNNAASDAISVMMMNKLIVTVVFNSSSVCRRLNYNYLHIVAIAQFMHFNQGIDIRIYRMVMHSHQSLLLLYRNVISILYIIIIIQIKLASISQIAW